MLSSIEQDEVITKSDLVVDEPNKDHKQIDQMSPEEFEEEWKKLMESVDTDSIFKMNF
jgi:hypothetical protein